MYRGNRRVSTKELPLSECTWLDLFIILGIASIIVLGVLSHLSSEKKQEVTVEKWGHTIHHYPYLPSGLFNRAEIAQKTDTKYGWVIRGELNPSFDIKEYLEKYPRHLGWVGTDSDSLIPCLLIFIPQGENPDEEIFQIVGDLKPMRNEVVASK